jgi:regulator of Ty1 transposition protein 109
MHTDHMWIQLFACTQGQYLFPDSVGYMGKRPLGNIRLCTWWMHVLDNVGCELVHRERGRGRGQAVRVGMDYVLLGLSALKVA